MVFSVDLAFTLLLSPVPINLLLQTASNRLPGDDSSALRRLQGLGNGRDRGPDIAQLRRQYHGVLVLASLPNSVTYCSATRRATASLPPAVLIASATMRRPSAVALATSSICRALPSASLICRSLSAIDRLMVSC